MSSRVLSHDQSMLTEGARIYDLTQTSNTKIHGSGLIVKGIGVLVREAMESSSEQVRNDLLEIADQLVEIAMSRLTEAQDVTQQICTLSRAN